MNPNITGKVLQELLAGVIAALGAEDILILDEPDQNGLQFDAKYQGRDARIAVTQQAEDQFRIYIFDTGNMQTMYDRTGIELDELPKVFAEDILPAREEA